MIFGSHFINDPDWVQDLQHDLYWSIVLYPFELARNIYLTAEKTLGTITQLGQDCLDKNNIDHRVLQYFHDTIAAKFRFEYINDFEMTSHDIQDGVSKEDDTKHKWLLFFKKQTEDIFNEYQNLPRQVLIACTYPNPDNRGKDAEDYIFNICEIMNSYIK